MKEFEKWAKEKGYDLYRHTNDSWELGISTGIEKGWREALEMLSNKLKHITDPPSCRCLLSVQEIIDGELKK